jgi:hypothetical protein
LCHANTKIKTVLPYLLLLRIDGLIPKSQQPHDLSTTQFNCKNFALKISNLLDSKPAGSFLYSFRRSHPWPCCCSSVAYKRRKYFADNDCPGYAFRTISFESLERFGPGAMQFHCEATHAALPHSGHQRAVCLAIVFCQLSVVQCRCLSRTLTAAAGLLHTHGFQLDPGLATALDRGSALGMQMQLRALFLYGGVVVLIVCC